MSHYINRTLLYCLVAFPKTYFNLRPPVSTSSPSNNFCYKEGVVEDWMIEAACSLPPCKETAGRASSLVYWNWHSSFECRVSIPKEQQCELSMSWTRLFLLQNKLQINNIEILYWWKVWRSGEEVMIMGLRSCRFIVVVFANYRQCGSIFDNLKH